jgi:two-component sensor histidine kinase
VKFRLPASTRLLIAEDDPLIRRSLVSAARERGFRIAGEASTGPEAVAQTLALRPDAILMDIEMPGFCGLEAAKRIQLTHPTPIVIVTGHDSPDLPQSVAETGAGATILKPADPAELEYAVVIAMARHADLLELKRLVQQKELLIREVYHRVANQLGATASLLYLQGQRESHPGAKSVLFESEQRMRAMAKVNSLLQADQHFDQTPLAPHLSTIASSLIRELRPDLLYQESLPGESLMVPSSTAMTCGLLVHELVMNSLLHAFPEGRTGTIALSLSRLDRNWIRCVVNDDGKGMPKERATEGQSTLGLMIVSALSADLGGLILYPQPTRGTTTTIEFPIIHHKESS